MSEFLNTRLSEIRSGELLALIEELELACPVGSRHFVGSPLIHFLTQCVYPRGASEKRVALSTALATHTPLLDSRIGKLPDGDLRGLCTELARLKNTALEFYSGNKLTVFLNKTLPRFTSSKKSTASQQRFDALTRRRRANRGG